MPTYHPVEAFILLEALDPAEYAALSADAKEAIKIILSCGTVNMAQDGVIFSYLSSVLASSPNSLAAIAGL